MVPYWFRYGIYNPPSALWKARHEDRCARGAAERQDGTSGIPQPPSQQKIFDRFRREYNEIRPHEALDDRVPVERYLPSQRTYSGETPGLDYPAHFERRQGLRHWRRRSHARETLLWWGHMMVARSPPAPASRLPFGTRVRDRRFRLQAPNMFVHFALRHRDVDQIVGNLERLMGSFKAGVEIVSEQVLPLYQP